MPNRAMPRHRGGSSAGFRRSLGGTGLGSSGLSHSFLRQTLRNRRQSVDEAASRGFQYVDPSLHNEYDPLQLLKSMSPLVSGIVHIRSKAGIRAKWDSYFAELRGTTILLFHDQFVDWAGAATNPPVLALCSVLGCQVRQQEETIILSRPGGHNRVHMQFQCDPETFCKWARLLTAAASEIRVARKDFQVLCAIGAGYSGKVFLVRDRRTNEKLAMKCVDKSKVFATRSAYRHALDERLMLEMCHGERFFVQLRYAFQTRRKIYFVTEFCEGGDLFHYLETHGGKLSEAQTTRVAAAIILALECMHKRGILYRDLKPENVLLDGNGQIKIADFGLCKNMKGWSLTETIVGTPNCAAPEMLVRRQYGASVDIWTLGIFIYHIWQGITPFHGDDVNQVFHNMHNREVFYPPTASSHIVDLISRLLERQPELRLGCGICGIVDVKLHSFFRNVDWKGLEQGDSHSDDLQVSLEAAPEEVANVDINQWRNVRLDEDDQEGELYDETLLWPIQKIGRHHIPNLLIVGLRFDHEYMLACRRISNS